MSGSLPFGWQVPASNGDGGDQSQSQQWPMGLGSLMQALRSQQYAGDTTQGVNSYIGPGRARVTSPSMMDVQPLYGDEDMPHQPVLSNEEQNWLDTYNSLLRVNAPQSVIDYHKSQNPSAALAARIDAGKAQVPQDVAVIMRAMQARAGQSGSGQ